MIKEEVRSDKQRELLVKKLGIFELRALARELGDTSPSTKKRDELIDVILKSLDNGESIDNAGKRKGRPYKKLSSLDDIVNNITNEKVFKLPEQVEYESLLTFAQETPFFSAFNEEKRGIFEGYVRRNSDGYSSIFDPTTDSWVFIKNFIDDYEKLNIGDKIKVEAKGLASDTQYEAISILSINGKNPKDYVYEKITLSNEIISTEKISFDNKNALVGRRNVLSSNEDVYENNTFDELVKISKENGYKVVLLAVNTSYENNIKFKSVDSVEKFVTEYGTKSLNNFNAVIDVINYCQNRLNHGEKVILFISDIMDVLRGIDDCFPKDFSNEYSEQSLVIVRKLLSLGRAYQDGNSCTLILKYNPIDGDDKFLKNDILKISKNI